MQSGAEVRSRGRRIFRLAGTGFWAVMDQGLFSGSNFVLNVMLARWLGQQDFGVFSLAYSMLLLMGTFHTAFITQPMLVFAGRRYEGRFGSYLRTLLRGHWLLTSFVSSLMALAGLLMVFVLGRTAGVTLVACAVVTPVILVQWMLRKACYVHLEPRVAAYAGGVYVALMVGGILALHRLDWLNSTSAFVLLGVASLAAAGLLLAHLLRHETETPTGAAEDMPRSVLHHHWVYGRWGIGAVFLSWFGTDAYYLGITFLHGFEATGALRAAMNLVLPAKQTFVALSTVALPMMVSARASGRLRHGALTMFGLFLSAAIVYTAVLVTFREDLVTLLYGAAYQTIVPAVLILGFLPLFNATVRMLNTTLHALEHPRGIFTAAVPSSLMTLTLGMYLTWRFGTLGAAAGLVAGALAGVTALSIVLWRRTRRPPEPASV